MNIKINTIKPNFTVIVIKNFTLYFSYETVVAYEDLDTPIQVSENVWTKTTGKHLNMIDPDKTKRIPYDQFQKNLQAMLLKHNF